MISNKPYNIDEYIASFPPEIQEILAQIRTTVQQTVPDAVETIKYAMPTFTLHGRNLVYFAAFKNHIGFYPAPTGNVTFVDDLVGYKQGRGSVQFPLNQPIPLELIAKITKFYVQRMNPHH